MGTMAEWQRLGELAGVLEPPLVERPCPGCGVTVELHAEAWAVSVEPRRGTHGTTGVDRFRCTACGRWRPAADWHRAHERVAFAASGVATPRMLRQSKHDGSSSPDQP